MLIDSVLHQCDHFHNGVSHHPTCTQTAVYANVNAIRDVLVLNDPCVNMEMLSALNNTSGYVLFDGGIELHGQ